MKAFALTVVLLVTNRPYLYTGENDVGVEPSVVYRIVAPRVEHEIVTNTQPVDVCGVAGLILGVATHTSIGGW